MACRFFMMSFRWGQKKIDGNARKLWSIIGCLASNRDTCLLSSIQLGFIKRVLFAFSPMKLFFSSHSKKKPWEERNVHRSSAILFDKQLKEWWVVFHSIPIAHSTIRLLTKFVNKWLFAWPAKNSCSKLHYNMICLNGLLHLSYKMEHEPDGQIKVTEQFILSCL